MVLPVQHHRRLSEHESEVGLGVVLTEAVVRTSAKDEIVLGPLDLGIARVVPLGIEIGRASCRERVF